jgi:hypothetical protein
MSNVNVVIGAGSIGEVTGRLARPAGVPRAAHGSLEPGSRRVADAPPPSPGYTKYAVWGTEAAL